MDYLRYLERPTLRKPRWIGAFVGWADAQEGASRSIRYIVESLQAKKFAEIDAEEFYDFTAVRPMVYTKNDGERVIRWPSNNFYYWTNPVGERDLLVFLGTEPSLKWRAYTQTLIDVMDPYGVTDVLNLGSLMDAVPHTRETPLSGGANKDELLARLTGLRIMGRTYQGPVGITSVFMDACTKRSMDYVSLWGHAPHYVQRAPNWKVAKAIVAKVNQLEGLAVPVDDLERRAQAFEIEVTKAIVQSAEVTAYVKRLEKQHDATMSQGESLPSAETVVKELDDFFKRGGKPDEGFSSN